MPGKSLHILMVSMDYPPRVGGLAAHVYEISQALMRLGHRVQLLTRGNDRRAVDKNATSSVNTQPSTDKSAQNLHTVQPYRVNPRLPGFLQGFTIQRAIDRLIAAQPADQPFDLLHLHGLRCLEHCPKRRIPQVFTNHTSGFLGRMQRGGRHVKRLIRLLAHTDLLLAPSRELLQIPGDSPPLDRRIYIPNGIRAETCERDLQMRQQLRRQLGLGDDERLAIVTRRLVEKNGVIHLARALSQHPAANLKLLLIGDGPERPAIEAELNSGFAGRFFLKGALSREELLPWYSAADFAVLPSLMEATSISGLEAMAACLPLIGTNVGGIPDLLKDNKNGILVPPADPVALAQAMGDLAALKPEILTAMGEASRKIAATDFNWRRLAQRTAECYHRVLAD